MTEAEKRCGEKGWKKRELPTKRMYKETGIDNEDEKVEGTMAQFAFKATWNDSVNVLRNLLSHQQYVLIPNLRYDAPKALELRAISDSPEELFVSRLVFIRAERFSRLPTNFRLQKEGVHAGKYFVDPSEGGPLLSFLIPPFYEIHPTLGPVSLRAGLGETSCAYLANGVLSYHRKTYDRQTTRYIKASPEVIAGFREVRQIFREKLVRRDHQFVGPEAKLLLDSGQAQAMEP